METRRSSQRQVILRAVQRTETHPGADWVYEKVKKKIPNISLGTIYRNLRSLTEEGMILELNGFGKPSRYEGITEPHSHFECEKCGKIVNLNGTRGMNAIEEVSREIGATVSNQIMAFRGVCQQCQAQKVHTGR